MSDNQSALEQFLQAPDPQLAEPDPDEEGDEIVFVRNGWVRVKIAGVMYKLRRPFLGELRDLEATMDHANEELRRLADDLRERERVDKARSDEIKAERDKGDLSEERIAELDMATTELMLGLQERFREVSRFDRKLREEWWAQAFKMLTPPGHDEPPSMPAWVGNALLQNQVLAHWQSSPLALGNA